MCKRLPGTFPALILLCFAALAGCKIEITTPADGKVVSESHTCNPGLKCTIDVSNTRFDQTFRAIPRSDATVFTGWKKSDRHFCGGSRLPCRLFTTTFAPNEALLALLEASDEVFYLSPGFEKISDNFPSGATPLTLNAKTVVRGVLGSERAPHDQNMPFGSSRDDSDYFVFVTPQTGDLTLTLSGLKADLDLTLEQSGIQVVEWSDNEGINDEFITARVGGGAVYLVNVFSLADADSPYVLTVSFAPDGEPLREYPMAGSYEVDAEQASGQCVDGQFLYEPKPAAVVTVKANGAFTLTEAGREISQENLVYSTYANNRLRGIFNRQDVLKKYHGNGRLAQVIERNIAGTINEFGFYAERTERTTEFASNGTRRSDCILYWPMYATVPRLPPEPRDPMQPELLSPAHTAQIDQNDPAIGCPAHPTRGYGFRLDFDWTDATSDEGIAGYKLVVKGRLATRPLIDQFVTESAYSFLACNAFIDNMNASTGFNWSVQARDRKGNLGPINDEGFFVFNLCILNDGSLCHAN